MRINGNFVVLLIWLAIFGGVALWTMGQTRACNAKGGAYVSYQCLRLEVIR